MMLFGIFTASFTDQEIFSKSIYILNIHISHVISSYDAVMENNEPTQSRLRLQLPIWKIPLTKKIQEQVTK